MKRYLKELILLILQLVAFYILPLYAGPTDTMGLVGLIILCTFILSIVEGIISNNKIKYLYAIIVSIIFIPSIYIYYNDSAIIHILWYLVVSIIGLVIGSLIRRITYGRKDK